MFWALAPLVLSAIQQQSGQTVAKGNADATNIVNDANTYASNLIRSSNNQLKAARGNLARYNQSVQNQRVLENTGSAAEAAAINYRRARDAQTSDNFESQIAFSEQAGAQATATALSGLTGGVADTVASTTALRKSRIEQRIADSTRGMDYDAAQRQKNILQAGWDSLDFSEIDATLDYSNDVSVRALTENSPSASFLNGTNIKALANMASEFKSFFNTNSADMFAAESSASSYSITGGR